MRIYYGLISLILVFMGGFAAAYFTGYMLEDKTKELVDVYVNSKLICKDNFCYSFPDDPKDLVSFSRVVFSVHTADRTE